MNTNPAVKMTERRRRMLQYMERFVLDMGYGPTVREIGRACEISSTSVVHYNLERLRQAGLVVNRNNHLRGIRVVDIPEAEYSPVRHRVRKRVRRYKECAVIRSEQGCWYCGNKELPLLFDHFYPIARGGSKSMRNTVPCCEICNRSKADKDPVEWVIAKFGPKRLSEIIAGMLSDIGTIPVPP